MRSTRLFKVTNFNWIHPKIHPSQKSNPNPSNFWPIFLKSFFFSFEKYSIRLPLIVEQWFTALRNSNVQLYPPIKGHPRSTVADPTRIKPTGSTLPSNFHWIHHLDSSQKSWIQQHSNANQNWNEWNLWSPMVVWCVSGRVNIRMKLISRLSRADRWQVHGASFRWAPHPWRGTGRRLQIVPLPDQAPTDRWNSTQRHGWKTRRYRWVDVIQIFIFIANVIFEKL